MVVRAPRTTKTVAGQPKIRRTTINFHAQAVKLDPIYLVLSTDNQKLGQTTRNCNLVVHGTTIHFTLILTLVLMQLTQSVMNDAVGVTTPKSKSILHYNTVMIGMQFQRQGIFRGEGATVYLRCQIVTLVGYADLRKLGVRGLPFKNTSVLTHL